MMNQTLHNEMETNQYGKELASHLNGGDILLLYGDLGAGKTTLTKGIAAGLGIQKDITSPTFTLMNVYPLKNSSAKNFVHIDTYRLNDEKELLAIGVEDYLGAPDSITIIEWPEKIEGLLLGKNVKKILLEHSAKEKRKITVTE